MPLDKEILITLSYLESQGESIIRIADRFGMLTSTIIDGHNSIYNSLINLRSDGQVLMNIKV